MSDKEQLSLMQYHGLRLKDAFIQFFNHDGPASAGNMAFLTMLSIFPFLIFLLSLSGLLGQTAQGYEAIQIMLEVVPAEVSAVLAGPIEGILKNTSGQVLTFSIFIALWTAGSGVEAARHALIRAFGKDFALAFWRRRLESLVVVMVAAVFVLTSISIQVIGPAMMDIGTSLFPDKITATITDLWVWLRYLISPVFLGLGLFGMYMALTPSRVKKPHRLAGSIFSLLVLMATTAGLSSYLKYMGSYDVTYGSLAGVVIMQIFCFIIAIGFILGAELNASYTREAQKRLRKSTKTPKTT